jgi:hypothetical protein
VAPVGTTGVAQRQEVPARLPELARRRAGTRIAASTRAPCSEARPVTSRGRAAPVGTTGATRGRRAVPNEPNAGRPRGPIPGRTQPALDRKMDPVGKNRGRGVDPVGEPGMIILVAGGHPPAASSHASGKLGSPRANLVNPPDVSQETHRREAINLRVDCGPSPRDGQPAMRDRRETIANLLVIRSVERAWPARGSSPDPPEAWRPGGAVGLPTRAGRGRRPGNRFFDNPVDRVRETNHCRDP